MRLLHRAIRTDVYRLYHVLRTLDDLVDDDQPEASDRVTAVEEWATDRRGSSPETRILADLSQRHSLPSNALLEFCQAMRHDIAREAIDTEEDLELYCQRAGGAVGIMLAQLLGVSGPEDEARMATLGRAVQRTNIIRDIDEDLASQRVYIARTTIERFGPPLPGTRLELLRDQIATADRLYDEATIRPRTRSQRAIALSGTLYREILRQIEREGYGRLPGRIAVPPWRRRMLVAKYRLRLA
jgi:phytoene synthase